MASRVQPGESSRFWSGVAEAEEFFMADDRVHRALRKLTRLLEEASIPYAVLGAMALNRYGYRRVTADVNVLLTREGLEALKALTLGLGYVEKFPGSKGMRDVENGVSIDVVLAGEYPGDGLPKSVVFPRPEDVGERAGDATFLPIAKLVELKLASGLSVAHRLRDLADVLELVRAADLPRDLGATLDPSVRDKYDELWQAAQASDEEQPPG